MDKKDILKAVQNAEFDYRDNIFVEELSDIIRELNADFYIEGIVSDCGRGELSYYVGYYEPKINSIIYAEDIKYELSFGNDNEVVDYIIRLEQVINKRKDFFKSLNK